MKKTLVLIFVLPLCLTLMMKVHAQADYSNGMSAYMNGDFQAAQTHWLSAAEQSNDPKAMFNLGLLHERAKVADASEEKAEQWFRLAGDAGYAAADYHLAQRLQQRGLKIEAHQLVQRSAKRGFVLAQESLHGRRVPTAGEAASQNKASQPAQTVATASIGNSPVEALNSKNAEAFNSKNAEAFNSKNAEAFNSKNAEAPNTNNVESLQSAAYLGERWVLAQPEDSWTIQMLAFSDEANVRNFIAEHNLYSHAAYFSETKGDVVLYKLIYGAFANKQAADEARNRLNTKLKQHGPWLRPIKSVQALINAR